MIAVEELLQPIADDHPSGADLRLDPVYDEIREARREDDNLSKGVWLRRRKEADFPLVLSLATEALKTRTKDLQIAAWLTEALLHEDGFPGLTAGLDLIRGLVDRFWDTLYPPVEDGDLELRASALDWLGLKLDAPIRNMPLNRAGHDWCQYNASRTIGYQWQQKDYYQKQIGQALIDDGYPTPETVDQACAETPAEFYVDLQQSLDASLASVEALKALCDKRFGEDAPWFGKLENALKQVRQVAHNLVENSEEAAPSR